jgi:hypothetical protein
MYRCPIAAQWLFADRVYIWDAKGIYLDKTNISVMRAFIWISILAILGLPVVSSIPAPTIPELEIKFDQASSSVNANASSQSVIFTGQVTVTKSPYLKAIVSLQASIDRGWDAVVVPSQMTFTSTDPQPFNCTVDIPPSTPGGMTAHLIINGSISSGIFVNTANATAAIMVTGTLPVSANQSGSGKPGGNQTDTGNSATWGNGSAGKNDIFGQLGKNALPFTATVVIIILVASVAGYVRIRSKRDAKVQVIEEVVADSSGGSV